VSAPPIIGPMILPIVPSVTPIPTRTGNQRDQTISSKLYMSGEEMVLLGLLPSGPAAVMVMKTPFTIPAPPIPCIALPIMTVSDALAVAAHRDPMKKINENDMYAA